MGFESGAVSDGTIDTWPCKVDICRRSDSKRAIGISGTIFHKNIFALSESQSASVEKKAAICDFKMAAEVHLKGFDAVKTFPPFDNI